MITSKRNNFKTEFCIFQEIFTSKQLFSTHSTICAKTMDNTLFRLQKTCVLTQEEKMIYTQTRFVMICHYSKMDKKKIVSK